MLSPRGSTGKLPMRPRAQSAAAWPPLNLSSRSGAAACEGSARSKACFWDGGTWFLVVGRQLWLALGWCCLGGSWTCSVWGRDSLSIVKDALSHRTAALTVLAAEEKDEPFSVEQEWMVCFSDYQQGQLEKRLITCLSKACRITCTRSTHLTPIHSEKQNLTAQNACTYVHARRAHAKSMCTGLAPPFVQH